MTGQPKPPRVVIFTARNCAHCDRAKHFLRSRKIAFQERKLDASRSAAAEFQRLGARGVPVILIGGRRIDGFQPERLGEALRHAGLSA